MIRPAVTDDAAAIADIYNIYVRDTVITFEEVEVTAAEMQQRIHKVQAAGLPWLVVEHEGQVLGYAYATPWKERSAYRYTVESSIYLAPQQQGRGWGTRLYSALFDLLQQHGVHVVIGGIALPNTASVALHEKLGMLQVAHFRETGFKFDRWIDVGCWQLSFSAAAASASGAAQPAAKA